jgi:fructose-specific phosphotransferase system IIA component
MYLTKIRKQVFFHVPRIMQNVFTLFQPQRSKVAGTPAESAEFEEHVENPSSGNGLEHDAAVLEHPEFCREDFFVADLGITEKCKAIEQLCKTLANHSGMVDYRKFYADVMKRENLKSTGIGYHVAIPHARSEYVTEIMIAVGKSSEGIHFDSPDDQPVHYIVLIGTPVDQVKGYLKLLARIARVFKQDDLREKLLNTDSAQEISALFRAHLLSQNT